MPERLATVVSIVVPDSADHRVLVAVSERVAPYGGRQVGEPGGWAVAFESPGDAVHFAVAVRAAARDLDVPVRAGLDHGPVGARTGDPRVVSGALAHYAAPGEILLTDIVCRLAGPVPGSHYVDRGRLRPPGLEERHQLHELTTEMDDGRRLPVLGREDEIDSIRRSLGEVVGGRGQVLFLEGPAGIGKSHLARAAASMATSMGVQVLMGAADELHRDRPAALLTAVAGSLGVRPPRSDPSGEQPTTGTDPAFAAVEQFVDAVSRAATARPLLVIAEDAHWADGLSLRAVTALVHAAPPLTVGVLVTFRPQPRPAQLTTCIDAAEAAHGEVMRLGALDGLATTGLVTARTGAVPGPRLRQLLEDAGGNPLYLKELIQALEEEGALRIESGVVEAVSERPPGPDESRLVARPVREGLTATIHRRLASMPSATNDLLRLASLLGTTFTLEDLATVASRRVVDVAADLMPALTSELVVGHGDVLRFHHDLVREAIYDAAPEAVRRDLHAAAGHALAAAGAPPSSVADQFGAGARVGDQLAIEWLQRAAAEALLVDTRTAVDRYEQALELLPDGDRRTRDRIEAVLVDLLAWSGRVEEARGLATSLLARSLSAEDERAARRALASTLALTGDLKASAEQCQLALQAGADGEEADVLRCAATGMSIIAGSGISEAIEVATGIADGGGRAPACWAEQTLGIAALAEGRCGDALQHFHRSRTLLDSGFVPPLGFLIPHSWEGGALAYLDRADEALERLQQTRARATGRGDVGLLVQAHAGIGLHHYLTGEWDDAGAEIDAMVGIASETGASAHLVLAHAVSAGIAFDRGTTEDAATHLEAGRGLIESGVGHLYGAELLAWNAARFVVGEGDRDGARMILEMVWAEMEPVVYLLQFDLVLPLLVALRREAGDDAGAAALADVVALAATRSDVGSFRAAALRCRGLAQGDPDPIVAAVELSRRSPRRLGHACLLEDAARALLGAGRVDEARPLVDEAIRLLDSLGAAGWARRLAPLAEATGLDRRPAPGPRATHGWESLSPKEHEVVSLVADGLSNPEIAERLFISRRTVESHLSHVFRKLDLSNRTQLARASLERER